MNNKPTNIPNLTPLRGIAAILVAVFHFNGRVASFIAAKDTLLLEKCYLMVDLFFIMSGFIMLHVYGSEFSRGINRQNFWKFIGARFARIYPLHFFTLFALVFLFVVLHQEPNFLTNFNAIPTHLLLLQSFWIHDIYTWNVASWSISAEWWVYMVFPFLVLMLSKYKQRAVIILFAVSVLLYIAIGWWLPRGSFFAPQVRVHNLDVTYDFGWVRGLAGFITGILAYRAYQVKAVFNFFKGNVVGFFMILVMIVLFHFGANDFLVVAFLIPFLLAIASNEGAIARLFSLRLPQFFGDISYSIYLTHVFAIKYFAAPFAAMLGFQNDLSHAAELSFFTGLGLCAVYLLVVTLVSTISYYVIERPCRNWLNKKFHHKIRVSPMQLA